MIVILILWFPYLTTSGPPTAYTHTHIMTLTLYQGMAADSHHNLCIFLHSKAQEYHAKTQTWLLHLEMGGR